jgi:pimeloyl-ACP methyl ester carboxylesterase
MAVTSTPADAALTVRVAGEGPEVVFVHGSLGDYRQWEPIAGALQARYRTVALSRRFHWPHPMERGRAGDSAARREAYTYHRHRDDLLGYLRGGARPVHLVGHSYGAGVVLLAAMADPALVRSMVLIEPAFGSLLPAHSDGLEAELASRVRMAEEIRVLVRDGRDDEAARRLIDWVQGDAGSFSTMTEGVRAALLDNAVTVWPTLAHAAPEVTCADVRELHTPALVVSGERTRPYYRLIAERLAACLPNARTARLPRAGHMTIVEQPTEAAELIEAFLAGCQAG